MAVTIEPQGPPGPDEPPAPLIQRLAWFVAIALAAAIATAMVAYALKALLPAH